ncbi:family 43 glycosylhydrolase [Mucilaginibacter endophyticus]|uniref:family 43 glycosylhydrolase n=1 Tax=Mucilaginibacter endophyticus TaxID=2675003 RepID=UPI000E0D0729|nr:family 43 glycosylhydrolase [Mucilaginibacter endophyticus]
MRKVQLIVFLSLCLAVLNSSAQQQSATVPGNGNPIIPGYFADPTVRKFGDTYYVYATTDGNGGGHGPSQVWTSKDFVNWTMHDMNWPTSNYYWAPDVIDGNDGKYYMYYCQPVDIYGASSTSPTGPWTPLLPDGKSMIPNYFIPGVITLDGQTFKDDDGKIYMFWGTWGIYPDHGCGVGLLNPDMHTFAKTAKIPNTIAKDFFEAPFMFKRKGIYYFTYSSGFCEDSTYRVQYAISKTGPMGPFEFGKNNPVLSTNSDGTIHGPGHESVVQVGDDFYMVYHRHNNPHSNGGYHRQVCADKIVFDADGNIEKIVPTHLGVGLLGKSAVNAPDGAYQKKVTASSYYNENYKPSFAVDNNNGSLWKPADNGRAPAWITIDLGAEKTVQQVLTQFEYATWYYQYLIESSVDGKNWKLFADRRTNKQHGSPMVDSGDAKARFIRLTITGTEYPGLYKAIWNVKVYGEKVVSSDAFADKKDIAKTASPKEKEGLLVNLDAANFEAGEAITQWANKGILGGSFMASGKPPVIDIIAGKKALVFNGTQALESTVAVPQSLAGNNSYTVSYEVYTDQIRDENPVLSWTNAESDHRGATFGFGSNKTVGAVQHFGVSDFQYKTMPTAGKWHQVVVTFDGSFEKLFVDGELNNTENKMLFLQLADKFIVGTKTNRSAYFSGAISSLKVYNKPTADSVIKQWALHPAKSDIAVYLDASKLNYGLLQKWVNNGEVGGAFQPGDGSRAEVADVAGKIAVNFNGKSPVVLKNDLSVNNKDGYSIGLSVYQSTSAQSGSILKSRSSAEPLINAGKYLSGGNWHYIIKTVSGNISKLYVDGALVSSTSNANDLTGELLLGNDFKGAVNSLAVYKHSLSSVEIKQLSNSWKQNYHPPVTGQAAFKVAPKAITPGMVEMQAPEYTSVKLNLEYDFINEADSSKSSGWQANPYYISYGLTSDKNYSYSFKVKDNYGNVSTKTASLPVSTSSALFNVVTDGFTVKKDFIADVPTGTIWNGLTGAEDKQERNVISGDSVLTLESKGSNWDGNLPYGPFLYRNVSGDFVAEVEVADVSGFKEKKVAGNSDMGLMVRKAKQPGSEGSENLIQNSIFPAWNCGNMFTNFKGGDRMQANTQTGWKYNHYLQIQKSGDVFYIRSSADAIHWTDLPESPVSRPDLNSSDLQIGLYHSTYGPHRSYVKFSDFKLISRK